MRSVVKDVPASHLLPAYTRASSLRWPDCIADAGVDAVYVCSPDATHLDHTLSALLLGKHVLCEKPLVGYHMVQGTVRAMASPPVVMVAFQRRFAEPFRRACQAVQDAAAPPKLVVVESYDPVPVDPDMRFVVNNSVCHDVGAWRCEHHSAGKRGRSIAVVLTLRRCLMFACTDMVALLFPTGDVRWSGGSVDAATSAVHLEGSVHHAGSGDATRVVIKYRKGHDQYVQRVTVDAEVYGYAYSVDAAAGRDDPYSVYTAAYRAQWKEFCEACATPSPAARAARVAQDARTFQLLEAAHVALGLSS